MGKRLLIISQVYPPDPAAVGQYLEEVAQEAASLGDDVTVFTARRGYDDPTVAYPAEEMRGGVRVVRLRGSSWGKRNLVVRLLGQGCFLVQCVLRGLFGKKVDRVLVSTSPPMAGWAGVILKRLRGIPFVWWVMDLNPDQAVALGLVTAGHPLARLFDAVNRASLRHAAPTVALDRFMADRLRAKLPEGQCPTIEIVPPWPMDGVLERIRHEDNPFRKRHGLEGKFVFMYSGNHSLVHPLDTVVEAASALREEERIVFAFIGGGKGKDRVEARVRELGLGNVLLLPYQPLEEIKYSLSAADVHIVSMGEAMVGCVHPCKFYGALGLGKPVFLLGPEASHVGEWVKSHPLGWQCSHGDTQAATTLFREISHLSQAELEAKGRLGQELIDEYFAEGKPRMVRWLRGG